MDPTIEYYQQIARTKLSDAGKELSKDFTFGWGGPIEWAIDMFPFIENGTENIKGNISDFPICIFQSRNSSQNAMIAVVPYITSDGNPTNTKLLTVGEISSEARHLVAEFSQAFLFLISSGGLPSPREKENMTKALISLTTQRLMMATI